MSLEGFIVTKKTIKQTHTLHPCKCCGIHSGYKFYLDRTQTVGPPRSFDIFTFLGHCFDCYVRHSQHSEYNKLNLPDGHNSTQFVKKKISNKEKKTKKNQNLKNYDLFQISFF